MFRAQTHVLSFAMALAFVLPASAQVGGELLQKVAAPNPEMMDEQTSAAKHIDPGVVTAEKTEKIERVSQQKTSAAVHAESACLQTLRALSQRIQDHSIIINKDGTRIVIDSSRAVKQSKMGPRAQDLMVYTQGGMTSVDGLSCNQDRTLKLEDGMARILELAYRQPSTLKKSGVKIPGTLPPELLKPAVEKENLNIRLLQKGFKNCSAEYPQVEELRQKLEFKIDPELVLEKRATSQTSSSVE